MWRTLGSLRESVKEGLQEFSRDALRETSLLRSSVASNVLPLGATGSKARDGGNMEEEEEEEGEEEEEERKAGDLRNSPSNVTHSGSWRADKVETHSSDQNLQSEERWEGDIVTSMAVGDDDSSGWESLAIEVPLSPVEIEPTGDYVQSSPQIQLLNNVGGKGESTETGKVSKLDGKGEEEEDLDRISLDAGTSHGNHDGASEGLVGQKDDGYNLNRESQAPVRSSNSDEKTDDHGSKLGNLESLKLGGTVPPAIEIAGHNGEVPSLEKAILEKVIAEISTSTSTGSQIELARKGGKSEEMEVEKVVPMNVSQKSGRIISQKGASKGDALEEARIQAKNDRRELERLSALCAHLRSSLEEAVMEQTSLKEELAESKAESSELKEQVEELEAAANEAARMAEEELQAAQDDYRKLQDRAEAAEAKATAARKEREALEARVKTMTASLEKRMANLTSEVQARQLEVDKLREENSTMETAFSDIKSLLKEAVAERDGLSETLGDQERLVEELREDLENAIREAESARREAAESSVALAEAAAQAREVSFGRSMGEEERIELENEVKKAKASADAAAAEVVEWKEKSRKMDVERKGRLRALAQAEAELASAHERALAAEAEAEEAKRRRAEAEGTSEQLREQTERRAKVFNAAVRAAVTKIQSELESERDDALERIRTLEADTSANQEELTHLQEQVQSLLEEIETLHDGVNKTAEEKEVLSSQIKEMEGKLSNSEEREKDALLALEAAREVSKSLTTKVLAAELQISFLNEQCQELQKEINEVRNEGQMKLSAIEEERERLKHQIVVIEQEKTSLKLAAMEATEDSHELKLRITELENRLSTSESRALRLAETSRKHLADTLLSASKSERGGSALAGLELQVGLRDLESANEALLESKGKRVVKREVAPQPWLRRHHMEEQDRTPGRISRRSFLLGLYIMLLHVIVMVSFTHHSNPCSVTDLPKALPGS